MSISLAHCITLKNQLFTHSPVLVHKHVHSTDLLSHCITQESRLEFLVNSAAQRRLIHHLHLCSHDDAPNTLGFHTFTLCSATGTSNSTDRLSHMLHIKITHFDSVASVAFCSQGRKCRMLLTSVASVKA
jgi:hypothetical protein